MLGIARDLVSLGFRRLAVSELRITDITNKKSTKIRGGCQKLGVELI